MEREDVQEPIDPKALRCFWATARQTDGGRDSLETVPLPPELDGRTTYGVVVRRNIRVSCCAPSSAFSARPLTGRRSGGRDRRLGQPRRAS